MSFQYNFYFFIFTSILLFNPISSILHNCADPTFSQAPPNTIVECEICAKDNSRYSYTFKAENEYLVLDKSVQKLYEQVKTTCDEPKWSISRFQAVNKECYVVVTYRADKRDKWINKTSGSCIAHKGRFFTADSCEIILIKELKWTVDGKASTLPLKFACKKHDPALKNMFIVEESTCSFPTKKFKNSFHNDCDQKSERECPIFCMNGTSYNRPSSDGTIRWSQENVICNSHDVAEYLFDDCTPNECDLRFASGSYKDIKEFAGPDCKHVKGNRIQFKCYLNLKGGRVYKNGNKQENDYCSSDGKANKVLVVLTPSCVFDMNKHPSFTNSKKILQVSDGCLKSQYERYISVFKKPCMVTMGNGFGVALDGKKIISTNPLTCPENIPPYSDVRGDIIVLECDIPFIENGIIICKFDESELCTVLCFEGYGSDVKKVYCTASGMNTVPACTLIVCHVPDVINKETGLLIKEEEIKDWISFSQCKFTKSSEVEGNCTCNANKGVDIINFESNFTFHCLNNENHEPSVQSITVGMKVCIKAKISKGYYLKDVEDNPRSWRYVCLAETDTEKVYDCDLDDPNVILCPDSKESELDWFYIVIAFVFLAVIVLAYLCYKHKAKRSSLPKDEEYDKLLNTPYHYKDGEVNPVFVSSENDFFY